MSKSNIGKWIKFGEFRTAGDLKRLIGNLDDGEELGFINGPREHLYKKEEADGSVWFGFQPDAMDVFADDLLKARNRLELMEFMSANGGSLTPDIAKLLQILQAAKAEAERLAAAYSRLTEGSAE